MKQNLKQKYWRLRGVLDTLYAPAMSLSQANELVKFVKTNKDQFNPTGLALLEKSKMTLFYYQEAVKRNQVLERKSKGNVGRSFAFNMVQRPDLFLQNFTKWYEEFKGKFLESLMSGLLQAFMAKTSGVDLPLMGVVYNFYGALQCKDVKSFQFVSGNLLGPTLRAIQKQNAKSQPKNQSLSTLWTTFNIV